MKNLKLNALILALMVLFAACNDDDNGDPVNLPSASTINLDFDGLEDLGADFAYEGWLIVDGAPVSTGTFTVDGDGNLSQSEFEVEMETLESATTFVLSIEPVPDNDPAPAATKLFAGDFVNNSATMSTAPVAASFDNVGGSFIVAAPTGSGDESEAYSGIWFLDPEEGMSSLELPELNDGWKYEGWVVIDGVPVTTGTFTSLEGNDDSAPFSGDGPAPAFPGEDFLLNAPDGLTFPTDIRNRPAVISIEPFPDNSPAPFTLKPLFQTIPEDLDGMGPVNFGDYVEDSFPMGTVSRTIQ
ncbi:anti-sigma factor domain-containing protein [Persicobacter diffluens]|uniref:Anti-sigma K factor RskA C-terminal domain-containing protein n=1 Tax=Persicobacter diffluens TaxID=981 RepID=A0AAN5AL82_9BACT|nr:hypothetical protein PEDI_31290 [Persicobacter diffluens]